MEKESTFGSLLRHEVDLHRSNPARLLITGLMMIIVILALYRGGAIFHHRAESVHEAQAAAEREWAKFKPEQWLNAGVGSGKWIYQSPLPSSMLMDGISRNQTAGLRVRVGLAPAHRTELTDGQQAWNPQVSRFGSLDLGFVLTVLAPLWVILLTFDAVSGEKERGTLRLLFSYPVDRKSYLNAKALGLLIWVVVPISIALFIGLLINGFSGYFQNGFIHPMRLILFASTGFLYLAFWGLAGLWASARSTDSRRSLMLLLLVWVVFTFFIPRIAMIVGDQLHPRATKMEIDIAKRALLTEGRRILDEDHHGKPPASWMEERVLVAGKILPKEAEIDRAFAMEREAAHRTKTGLASLSPMAVTSFALMDLAGTGERRYRHFIDQVESYRHQFSGYYASVAGQEPKEVKVIFAGIPGFQYREESLAEVVGRTWPKMFWLALLAGMAYAAVVRGISRYDMR